MKNRRFRFTLLGLFLAVTATAVVIGVIGERIRRYQRQQQYRQSIEKFDPDTVEENDWVIRLSFRESEPSAKVSLGDDELREIHLLQNLEWLDLSNTSITDECLASIRQLPHLKRLDLEGTKISSAGLGHLKEMTQLERLIVSRTELTRDEVMQLITALPNTVVEWARE